MVDDIKLMVPALNASRFDCLTDAAPLGAFCRVLRPAGDSSLNGLRLSLSNQKREENIAGEV
jgi:hypothetical protein